jgi:hypothetical protein
MQPYPKALDGLPNYRIRHEMNDGRRAVRRANSSSGLIPLATPRDAVHDRNKCTISPNALQRLLLDVKAPVEPLEAVVESAGRFE